MVQNLSWKQLPAGQNDKFFDFVMLRWPVVPGEALKFLASLAYGYLPAECTKKGFRCISENHWYLVSNEHTQRAQYKRIAKKETGQLEDFYYATRSTSEQWDIFL